MSCVKLLLVIFVMSPGDYHQFSRHASGLPFTLEATCAEDMSFFNDWTVEIRSPALMLAPDIIVSEAGTSTSQFAVNFRRHPTYNKCL